jgi:hypothetical protein
VPRRPRPVEIDPAEMRRVYAERLDALVDIGAAGTIGDAEFASNLIVGRALSTIGSRSSRVYFTGQDYRGSPTILTRAEERAVPSDHPMGGRRMVGWPHRSVKSVPFRDVAGSTPVPLTHRGYGVSCCTSPILASAHAPVVEGIPRVVPDHEVACSNRAGGTHGS